MICNDEFTPRRLDKAFDTILHETDLSRDLICDIAKVTGTRNIRFSKLDFTQVNQISNYLNVSFEKIVDGTFCRETLRAHLEGNLLSIPKRYRDSPNSNMFTFRHLHQLATQKGFGDYLLHHFQITQEALAQDMPISVELLADALRKFHFSIDELISCGEKNPYYLENSDFGKKLKSARTPVELIENWLSVEKYLEENWYYEIIKLNNKECLFNGYPTESMLEYHKRPNYSSLDVSYIRLGAAKVFSTFIGKDKARISLPRSIHRGDPYDQFHLLFK